MNDYDVGKIFQDIELELINSMRRNLARHEKWEELEGFEWEQWQAKKIRELRKFKAQNKAIMAKYSRQLDRATKGDLKRQYLEGGKKVDKEVSRAVKKGFSLVRGTPSDDFFQGNNRRLNSLINAISNDFTQAQNAALRQMDDVYRRTVFKAETFLNTGASTLDQAIDMATKDFLAKGIDCITYSDGRKVNIASYAQMAVRTANRRVHLMGEGERRKEWGLSLVLISQYSQSSPTCQPWQGRVYIDDVYSGGKIEDGEYPLLSQAIEAGLFHPNCKHTSSTFFEDINTEPEPMYKDELGERYEKAKREAEIKRNIQKYTRLKTGSIDPANIAKYDLKIKEWKSKLHNIDKEPSQEQLPELVQKFKSDYEAWDKTSITELSNNLLKDVGLSHLKTRYRDLGNSIKGQCQLSISTPTMQTATYELNSKDSRGIGYKVKTAFHELFHARSHGAEHGIGNGYSFDDWARIDDTFAESTAHYIVKGVGIETEITPAYPDHLIDILPRLKKTVPEFAKCNTIADFGKVAYDYRFGKKPIADWRNLYALLNKQNHDIIEYSRQYLDYIKNNKDDLLDKMLENRPDDKQYKSYMVKDLDGLIQKINNGGVIQLSSNEELVFKNVLIIAMNRVGVK